MRKVTTASFLLLLVLCASCTSTAPNGSRRSFSLLDIDLRSAEQVRAGLAEEQGVSAQAMAVDPGLLAAAVSAIKGRIGIGVYREQPALPTSAGAYSAPAAGSAGSAFENDGNGNYKGFVTVPLEMYIAPIRLTSGPVTSVPQEYVPPMDEEFEAGAASVPEVPIRNAAPYDPPPSSP